MVEQVSYALIAKEILDIHSQHIEWDGLLSIRMVSNMESIMAIVSRQVFNKLSVI